jgi:hypothetical protein
MLWKVRKSLLEEAKFSPLLLSDVAGLERYITESYDSRSFIELLQNADDADSSRFLIEKSGNLLFVANNGHEFNENEFESLCRSASSSKIRGESIGYRGIGFKSVSALAKNIYLVSGELEASFSKEKTAREVPLAVNVPLIRIPHAIDGDEKALFAAKLESLIEEGFVTIFVFEDVLADAIENEFCCFDFSSLLFLRKWRQLLLFVVVVLIIV